MSEHHGLGHDGAGLVPTCDPDLDDLDARLGWSDPESPTPSVRPPDPLEQDASLRALVMLQNLIAWAGGDRFRCAVLGRLIGQDSRPVTRIARDLYLDRHKVRRAYEAGVIVLSALRSARKQSLMNTGAAGDSRAKGV